MKAKRPGYSMMAISDDEWLRARRRERDLRRHVKALEARATEMLKKIAEADAERDAARAALLEEQKAHRDSDYVYDRALEKHQAETAELRGRIDQLLADLKAEIASRAIERGELESTKNELADEVQRLRARILLHEIADEAREDMEHAVATLRAAQRKAVDEAHRRDMNRSRA